MKRISTPISSGSSSNSSSNNNINNNIQALSAAFQQPIKFNEKDPQMIYIPKYPIVMYGNNAPWSIYRNHRLGSKSSVRQKGSVISRQNLVEIAAQDRNKRKSNFPARSRRPQGSLYDRTPGRGLIDQEAALFHQFSKPKRKDGQKVKVKYMTLYHSSPYSLNGVQMTNMILSPNVGFFHTHPKWKYHGNKRQTEYELHIPVNDVRRIARQSMAEFEKVNEEKGYSTLILPKTKSIVMNVKNNRDVKKVTSVYRPITFKN